jgi:heme A synthase
MSNATAGSGCLFCLLRFSNLLLGAVGLAVLALGIYTTVQAAVINWYNGAFIGAGFVIFLVAVFGYKNKRAPNLLTVYLILVFALFVCLVGFTLGIIFYPDYAKKVDSTVRADAIRYSLLGMCVIVLCCLMFGCWYRSSLTEAIFEVENQPVEHVKPLVTPKTDKAREAMYQKYPQLRDLHNQTKP